MKFIYSYTILRLQDFKGNKLIISVCSPTLLKTLFYNASFNDKICPNVSNPYLINIV